MALALQDVIPLGFTRQWMRALFELTRSAVKRYGDDVENDNWPRLLLSRLWIKLVGLASRTGVSDWNLADPDPLKRHDMRGALIDFTDPLVGRRPHAQQFLSLDPPGATPTGRD